MSEKSPLPSDPSLEGVAPSAGAVPSPSPEIRPIKRRSIANLGVGMVGLGLLPPEGEASPVNQHIGASRNEPVKANSQPLTPSQEWAPYADTTEGRQSEALHDAEVRYTDVELLGKSFRVRRNIQEAGNQAVKGWGRVWAAVRNTASLPRKTVKQFAYKRAQSSYDRKASKLEDVRGQSTRLVQHRETAVSQAKQKLDAKKLAFEKHDIRMKERVQTVHEKVHKRRQEYIDTKKVALENKLARQAVRGQLHTEGASRREARDILTKVSEEHLNRIGKVAITAEASRAMRERAERIQSKAVKAQGKNHRRIETTSERAERHDTAATQAGEIANNLASVLPFTESYVTVLQEKLAGMTEDNVDYSRLTTELQVAADKLAVQRREFDYWQGVSERKLGKADKAKARMNRLEEDRDRHTGIVRRSTSNVDAQHITHSLDSLQLGAEVHVALNPEKDTRKAV
jgi:hypothetical protein